jgi:hypothetical protein
MDAVSIAIAVTSAAGVIALVAIAVRCTASAVRFRTADTIDAYLRETVEEPETPRTAFQHAIQPGSKPPEPEADRPGPTADHESEVRVAESTGYQDETCPEIPWADPQPPCEPPTSDGRTVLNENESDGIGGSETPPADTANGTSATEDELPDVPPGPAPLLQGEQRDGSETDAKPDFGKGEGEADHDGSVTLAVPEAPTPVRLAVDTEPAATTAAPSDKRDPKAMHRDRRGSRRARQPARIAEAAPAEKQTQTVRAPAELRLRLILHPIRQSVQLALILARPEGFPPSSTICMSGPITILAFDESRYDDLDIDWLPETLAGELRFESPDGYRWVRSARRVQLFSSDPGEAGLVSVAAARFGAEHAVVCTTGDAETVRQIAASAGSPPLAAHDHWHGIPPGWCVLSGYKPGKPAEYVHDGTFRPLDPGYDIQIRLAGGLPIRSGVFAAGHPPRIETGVLPDGAAVRIDGEDATLGSDGGWEAKNWNEPGTHLIDIVPGPSLTYEIASDPADSGGWEMWDAHAARFAGAEPWARARICGAALSGPSGETLLAHGTRQMLIALGSRDDATALRNRPDVEASVALLAAPPDFLLAASGLRRRQGEVIWLGLEGAAARAPGRAQASTFHWASIVRSAAARRLALRTNGSAAAKDTWLKAVRRARALKRQEP